MNRILRIITTIMIAVGLFYIFYYALYAVEHTFDALYQPSYFVIGSYRRLFIAGVMTVAVTFIGNFFAWFKQMDTVKRELDNAINADASQIEQWLQDSTLRVNTTETVDNDQGLEKTEIVGDNQAYEKTEIVGDNQGYEKTEIIDNNRE